MAKTRASRLMLRGTGFSSTAPLGCRLIECGNPGAMASSRKWKNRSKTLRKRSVLVLGAVTPAAGDAGWDYSESLRQGLQNGSSGGSSRIYAKWKWWERKNESALDKDEALPLPMTYPNSEPLPKEEVEKAANCDPEIENCKNVVYQWTGECRRCQGTGVVSFYRKNGKEVIGNCISCLGIGARLHFFFAA
ncbi:protein disulfide-isomerase SCO2 [Selaginella moellendorffii]|nr:protein disulfide-isomerase SCO2 [Selaginella moellendorffii]|eukprot:XP_002982772.2 protein disulfide-isomerase SCO2 [Selaginella moellendorffii]